MFFRIQISTLIRAGFQRNMYFSQVLDLKKEVDWYRIFRFFVLTDCFKGLRIRYFQWIWISFRSMFVEHQSTSGAKIGWLATVHKSVTAIFYHYWIYCLKSNFTIWKNRTITSYIFPNIKMTNPALNFIYWNDWKLKLQLPINKVREMRANKFLKSWLHFHLFTFLLVL